MATHVLTAVFIIFTITYATSKPSVPTNAEGEPDIESIPSEVRKFYGSLNAEEKTALKEYAKDLKQGTANFSLTDNIADGIKSGSEGLINKLGALRDLINSKLNNLAPESRGFIVQMLRKFIIILGEGGGLIDVLMGMKNYGRDVLQMYDSLSDKTKQDLLKEFPTIGSIATSDIARVILNRLADYTPSVGWGTTPFPHDEPRKATKKAFTQEPPTRPPHPTSHSSIYPAVTPNASHDDTAGEEEIIKLKVVD
uniref:Fatty-acid and retinol-binding protein 1 n=1 Tax=Ascaris lumbricoides TaxID=6252 RepID=A0A0M3IFG2_ASCLU